MTAVHAENEGTLTPIAKQEKKGKNDMLTSCRMKCVLLLFLSYNLPRVLHHKKLHNISRAV